MKHLLFVFVISSYSFGQQGAHDAHIVKDDKGEVEAFERGREKVRYKPVVVEGIQKYAIDEKGKPQHNFGVVAMHDNEIFAFLYADRLEQRFQGSELDEVLLWDINAWIGNKTHKVFFESEGEYNTTKGESEASRNEILYGTPYSSFWDVQVGYRRDLVPKKQDREFFVLSTEGMAPFLFEVDAASYIDGDGVLSFIFEAEYSLRLSQRSVLIPRFETELSTARNRKYLVGSGVQGVEMGLRLSHQIIREIEPYIGISWEQKLFDTADLIEAKGTDTSVVVSVLGLRLSL